MNSLCAQTEGFLNSLLALMRVELAAPDYTTLARRTPCLNGVHRLESRKLPVWP